MLCHTVSYAASDGVNELKDDEGYLLVAISMHGIWYETITIDGGGSLWYAHDFTRDELADPVNFKLIKLPAGRYFWKKIKLFNDRFYDFDKSQYPMTVEAGRINYGGHFRGESVGKRRAVYQQLNRVTSAIDLLESKYPDLLRKYPMRFGAPGTDPFVDHYFSVIRNSESDQ